MKTFWSHVRTCVGRYVCFSGNATRSEFWSWVLFVAGISGLLLGAAGMLAFIRSCAGPDTISNPLYWLSSVIFYIFMLLGLFLLFCLLPTLAVAVRRLRDAGYCPWIIIIPVFLLIGSWYPALLVALFGMDTTSPEMPLSYCYSYLAFTAVVCLLYAIFLNRTIKSGS